MASINFVTLFCLSVAFFGLKRIAKGIFVAAINTNGYSIDPTKDANVYYLSINAYFDLHLSIHKHSSLPAGGLCAVDGWVAGVSVRGFASSRGHRDHIASR